MAEMSAIVDIAKIFLRWLHLQVSPWEVLSILLHFALCAKHSISIILLAAKGPDHHPNSCEVADWKATIRRLVKQHWPLLTNGEPIDPDVIVGYLESKIQTALKKNGCHPIFHRFQSNNLSWQATLHCELILATLFRLISDMSAEDLICDLLIVIFYYYYYIYLISMQGSCTNTSPLAVSKLCCPVCAEVLKALKTPSSQFVLWGNHNTIYQAELPPWIPDDTLGMVLDKFIEILLKLVATMMGTPARKKCHAQKVSTESQNVYDSGGSTSSYDPLFSDMDDSDSDNWWCTFNVSFCIDTPQWLRFNCTIWYLISCRAKDFGVVDISYKTVALKLIWGLKTFKLIVYFRSWYLILFMNLRKWSHVSSTKELEAIDQLGVSLGWKQPKNTVQFQMICHHMTF